MIEQKIAEITADWYLTEKAKLTDCENQLGVRKELFDAKVHHILLEAKIMIDFEAAELQRYVDSLKEDREIS